MTTAGMTFPTPKFGVVMAGLLAICCSSPAGQVQDNLCILVAFVAYTINAQCTFIKWKQQHPINTNQRDNSGQFSAEIAHALVQEPEKKRKRASEGSMGSWHRAPQKSPGQIDGVKLSGIEQK